MTLSRRTARSLAPLLLVCAPACAAVDVAPPPVSPVRAAPTPPRTSSVARPVDARLAAEPVSVHVSRVGRAVARRGGAGEAAYRFHVLETSAVNCFSLPGGNVYVTRGLLDGLNGEAELAAVLADELGELEGDSVASLGSTAERVAPESLAAVERSGSR